jgi:uncharacterized coiled-coil protein SlyX
MSGDEGDDVTMNVTVGSSDDDEDYAAFLAFCGAEDESRNEEEEGAPESDNLARRRTIDELEAGFTHQDAQIDSLNKQIEQLHIELNKIHLEKEAAVRELRQENEIIEAQRSALEEYLVELNRSAGYLRDSASSSVGECDGTTGEAPIRAVQMAALEQENEALRLSVNSLRQSFAMLEEEKRMVEEDMKERLSCRESTIDQLENALQRHQQAIRTRISQRRKTKKMKKVHASSPATSPDEAAGGH